jgi:hypothetical protein
MADALPAVRRFAQASRQDAAVAAGEVLAALERALETLPDATQRVRDKLSEVHFESERLRRSDRMSFGIPKWLKLGLAAAVDALETLTPPAEARTYWIELARQTQGGIDADAGAAFQRAALQDALRTTTTVFVIVGQGLEVCR